MVVHLGPATHHLLIATQGGQASIWGSNGQLETTYHVSKHNHHFKLDFAAGNTPSGVTFRPNHGVLSQDVSYQALTVLSQAAK